MATITLDLVEWETHATKLKNLENEIARLRSEPPKELAILSPDTANFSDIIRAGLDIARFAVSNLDPEFVRNWPWRSLEAFATGLEHTPGLTVTELEVPLIFRRFAQECAQLERERALGTHKEREKLARGSVEPA
jgi:hypothetical protein